MKEPLKSRLLELRHMTGPDSHVASRRLRVLELRADGLRFRVSGLGVWGLGFRGLGFWGFKVQGFGV